MALSGWLVVTPEILAEKLAEHPPRAQVPTDKADRDN
jgi:hypothetical protein